MTEKKWHHSTAEERQAAFDLLAEGKTIAQTARLCGVHHSTIKAWNRNRILRGPDYETRTKYTYRQYSYELKLAAVAEYLKCDDATRVAKLFDILNPTTVSTWARDERYRGGIPLPQERKPRKIHKKRESISPQEEMSQEEELRFLRMENAILKKAISLRAERQQPKKK
jgi:transposase-like protein